MEEAHVWEICSLISFSLGNGGKLLKEKCPAEIVRFRLAYFHVISPNAGKYTTKLDKKRSIEQNNSSSLEIKFRIARIEVDYSS